jgi:GH18 family chitinase
MNPRFFVYSLVIISLSFCSCNNKGYVAPPKNNSEFRVLGYLHSANNWMNDLNAVDLSLLTDLNLAFINPDATGKVPVNDSYRQVIEKAHGQKVRVFLSFGGGSPPPHLAELLKFNNRTSLVNGLVSAAEQYGFDGVDVDLENALINADYAPFVKELSTALKAKSKLMTAALASWNSNLVADSTLQLYDFINIMSYDKTGPWNLNNPGQHSPFSMAEADFNYYHKTRNISAEKLFVGLPFYGYGFGTGAPESMNYKDIIQAYPGAELKDSVVVPGGGTLYYNGVTTIRQKVNMAITNRAGGVMIWQVRGDAAGEKSLLKAINQEKSK